jgi:hypothetical protein
MKVLICLILAVVPVPTFASENCVEKVTLYALETLNETVADDFVNENKIGSNGFSVEIGKPRIQKDVASSPEVAVGYSVQVKIKSGKNVWDFETLYLLGKDCERNVRAEREFGKRSKVTK